MKEANILNTLEHFSKGVKKQDEFQRPQDMIPTKKHRGVGSIYDLYSKGQAKKTLNLNIYKSKSLEVTKDDENYERRVQLKDLLFYMQRDPQLSKSKVFYQTQVKF